MTTETPALRSIPAGRVSQQAKRATPIGIIRDSMERHGALLLGAQALLREMKNGTDVEDECEMVALLLDMAECNSTAPTPAPPRAERPRLATFPPPARPEAMQALSQDVQQRALRMQLVEALRAAEFTLTAHFGELGNQHPTLQKVRAALAAEALLSSES